MKNFRPQFVILALAATALSSCGRSYYSFQTKASTSAGTVSAPPAATAASDAALPVATASVQTATVSVARETIVIPNALSNPTGQSTNVAQPTEAISATSSALAPISAQAPPLPMGQRLLAHHVLKQVARASMRQQNTASVTHTTASGKGSLVIALVGLIALLIGIIASSGFLITVGIIVLVIGVVLFLLKKL